MFSPSNRLLRLTIFIATPPPFESSGQEIPAEIKKSSDEKSRQTEQKFLLVFKMFSPSNRLLRLTIFIATPPPFEASGQEIPAETIDSTIPGQTLDTAPAPAMKSSGATNPSQSVYVGTWESVGGALTMQTAPALMTPRSGVPIQTGAGIDPSTLGLYGKYVSKPPIEFTVTPEFSSYDFKSDLFAGGDIKFTATFRNNSDEPVTVSASYAMNVRLAEDTAWQNARRNLKMVPQTRLISWHETPTSLAARKLITLDPGEEFEFDFNGIADCYDYDAAVADGCRSKDARDILPRCIIYNITERGTYKLSFTYQYEGIDLGLPNVSREAIHSPEVTIHAK